MTQEDSSPATEVFTEERTYLDNSTPPVVQVKESVNEEVAKETTLRLDRAGRTIQREESVPGNAPALWVTEYDAVGNAWRTLGGGGGRRFSRALRLGDMEFHGSGAS